MSLVVAPLVELYRYVLTPIAPFTWFGWQISTLDVAAGFRLCIALRQFREKLHADHLAKSVTDQRVPSVESHSFVRDASATLTVVYGGEAVAAPFLGMPPSFMVSGIVPALYTGIQAIVEQIPSVPTPSLENELPLALMDGITRAYLLCNLIPPTVTAHASPIVAESPWTLLLTSLITANGGFFFTGLFSLLQPYAITVATPGELLPYGWSTTDLWCAPFITGLFALLTHAQPFWADAHFVLSSWLGGGSSASGLNKVAPVDPEVARAICAGVLAVMFSTRAVKNFGGNIVVETEKQKQKLQKAE